MCKRERQQELAQQQPHAQDLKTGSTTSHKAAGSSSSSSNESGGVAADGSGNLYSSWPVAYDDPFLWRRLMWKLLGKLSPHAQAFYAQYLALCPHCNDPE